MKFYRVVGWNVRKFGGRGDDGIGRETDEKGGGRKLD